MLLFYRSNNNVFISIVPSDENLIAFEIILINTYLTLHSSVVKNTGILLSISSFTTKFVLYYIY